MSKTAVVKTRWYYDACTIDQEIYKSIIRNVQYKHNPKAAVISHLALGEAYGNVYNKGREQAEAFGDFLELLRNDIEIVGNDGIDPIFDDLRSAISRISVTDLSHLATAIHCRCENVLSNDRDLTGLGRETIEKIRRIAIKYGV